MVRKSVLITNIIIWMPIFLSITIVLTVILKKPKNNELKLPHTTILTIDVGQINIPKFDKSCQKDANKKRIFLKRRIKLEGILFIDREKFVIINGNLFKEKEKIEDLEIANISHKEVIIRVGNKFLTLRIGEEIEI